MKKTLIIALIFPLFIMGQSKLENIEIQKIWDKADHSAFTDLIFFKGKFYCSFREGGGHVPGNKDVDGTVRIIESENGEDWKSVAHIKKEGFDLRDPKLSIMPDGRMLVTIGGSDYSKKVLNKRMPHVSFSKDGKKFTDPQPVIIDESIKSDFDWIWRVTWYDGVGYAVNYQNIEDRITNVVKTTDGIHYENVSELFISGKANEATIRFTDEGEMLILLRREGADKEGLLLRSKAPYDQFTWANLDERLGGPNFILIPNTDKIIIGTRMGRNDEAKTALFLSNYNGGKNLLTTLPSGGDNSYPGFVWKDNYLWVSYYSSHENKASIYLAKIQQEDIYKSITH